MGISQYRPDRGKAIGKIVTAFPRLPRAQSALAMTILIASRRRITAAIPATAIGAQGAPLQTQSVRTILTVLCANCKQLPRRPVGLPAMTNLRALHFPLSHDPVFFQEEL